jgi:hypothetical protein
LESGQKTMVSIPFPSRWGISADIAGRPIIRGTLIINSIKDDRVTGTVSFRGTPIPISGNWNETAKHISFDSPYATFSGNLTLFDDATIRIRHLILSGRFIMKPPSLQAGEHGSWVATTDTTLTGPPVSSDTLPPVGAFLTTDLKHRLPQ